MPCLRASAIEPSANRSSTDTVSARMKPRAMSVWIAPAASAYNAGEDLTSLWWKAHKAAGTDLFAEMIPYAETRGYVREVVANYETYLRLYPTPPAR